MRTSCYNTTMAHRKDIRKELVKLFQAPNLPLEYKRKFWIAEDLRNKLVECGLDHRVTVDDVRFALWQMSTLGAASINTWNGNKYFCLDPLTQETPKDQVGINSPNLLVVSNFWPTTIANKLQHALNTAADEEKENSVPDSCRENQETSHEHQEQSVQLPSPLPSSPTEAQQLPMDFSSNMPDGKRVIDNMQLGQLINWAFNHHKHCKRPACSRLQLVNYKKDGFAAKDTYCCTACNATYEFHTSLHVRTPVVSKGRQYSRTQYDMNVSIPASLKFAGLNAQQSQELFGECGIQAPARKNLLDQLKKVDTAVILEVQEKIIENRKKIIATKLSDPNFNESTDVLTWHEDGIEHKTIKIAGQMDAAGPTREYGN